jgi:hypothetical protein
MSRDTNSRRPKPSTLKHRRLLPPEGDRPRHPPQSLGHRESTLGASARRASAYSTSKELGIWTQAPETVQRDRLQQHLGSRKTSDTLGSGELFSPGRAPRANRPCISGSEEPPTPRRPARRAPARARDPSARFNRPHVGSKEPPRIERPQAAGTATREQVPLSHDRWAHLTPSSKHRRPEGLRRSNPRPRRPR